MDLSPSRGARRAFSLLEVILALAILTTAIAAIGELMRLGMRNAQAARDKTKAVLFCESRLAEIVAGAASAQGATGMSVDETLDTSQTGWSYDVVVDSISSSGLIAVTVKVYQNLPEEARPIVVSLTRWMVDPNSTQATTSDTEAMQ